MLAHELSPATPEESEAKTKAIAAVASQFHENWRKTRLLEDGSFEPRIKPTKDEDWISYHGTDQVDIANTSYDNLPLDWQAENKVAAEVVVGIIDTANGPVDLSDEAQRQRVGEQIHDAWLGRNDWARGGELDVPFSQLPSDEQAKDIDQMFVAQQVLSS